MKKEEDDIPFSVQLLPRQSSSSSEREAKDIQSSPFSDDVNSQGSKTPNLVARLMGLDLLPDETSSATSSPIYRRSSRKHGQSHQSFKHRENIFTCSKYESGSRSLPDTPRISSARRSDVDPRLSLQLNKENMDVSEFNYRGVSREAPSSSSPFSSRRSGRRRDVKLKPYEESNSPSKYAREIVKQVKESVSRRVGADITNVAAGSGRQDKEENFPTIRKCRGNVKPSETSNQGKHGIPSRSPRLRVSKQKTGSIIPVNHIHTASGSLKPQTPQQPKSFNDTSKPQTFPPLPKPTTKCKKASCERFTRKPKKSPPSKTIESLRAEVLPKNKVQGAVLSNQELPSSGSGRAPPYKQPEPLDVRDDNTMEAEFRYVRLILESTGIETRKPVSISVTKWKSPSQPLDPSLFHDLEYHENRYTPTKGPIRLKSYRKLLFRLADEILSQLLKPHLRIKPWLRSNVAAVAVAGLTGANLLEMLWARMNNFPGANCKTLQDIDALVGQDMPEMALCGGTSEVEWELVVFEIEREIVESLVEEAAVGLRRETAQR
ncbi:uncharacterized protein [Aristolochia californica]